MDLIVYLEWRHLFDKNCAKSLLTRETWKQTNFTVCLADGLAHGEHPSSALSVDSPHKGPVILKAVTGCHHDSENSWRVYVAQTLFRILILPIVSLMVIIQYHWTWPMLVLTFPLKIKDRQFDKFVITGGTVSCPNDNLQCHQWWQSCQLDDLLFSLTERTTVVLIMTEVCSVAFTQDHVDLKSSRYQKKEMCYKISHFVLYQDYPGTTELI